MAKRGGRPRGSYDILLAPRVRSRTAGPAGLIARVFRTLDPPCKETKILTEIEVSTRIESDICYVVDGFFFPGFPGGRINVRDGVNCAKITVPSGSTISYIKAHLPRPAFCPTKR